MTFLPRECRAWAACAAALCVAACGGGGSGTGATMGSTSTHFVATNLVSDVSASGNPYSGANVDGHLVNGWGIAFNPQGFVWVADNATSTSTLYDGNGVPQSLVVAIPPGQSGSAKPTGIVFNGSSGFAVSQGGASGASIFIFAGEGGAITGWAPNVNATNAVVAVDGAAQSKIYKGLAIASRGGAGSLYATDFHHGRVDVFDDAFRPVLRAGAFSDPNLPSGYAPFGIQEIGGLLYVAFAMQDAQAEDEVAGTGLGAVDVFDPDGVLVRRLIAPGGKLNAPWGMALAPADFGGFGSALLVGNFGDGRINAFDPSTGAFLGTISKADGSPIVIDGLWGIAFGNGINNQPSQTLFYAAGPADESHGVYGRIDVQ